VLTSKLPYSIHCFVLSSVEFILKNTKYFLKQEKKSVLICIKVLLKFATFGEEKKFFLRKYTHLDGIGIKKWVATQE